MIKYERVETERKGLIKKNYNLTETKYDKSLLSPSNKLCCASIQGFIDKKSNFHETCRVSTTLFPCSSAKHEI